MLKTLMYGLYGLRSPAGTTAENIFYLVATTSLSGGHHGATALLGPYQIKLYGTYWLTYVTHWCLRVATR